MVKRLLDFQDSESFSGVQDCIYRQKKRYRALPLISGRKSELDQSAGYQPLPGRPRSTENGPRRYEIQLNRYLFEAAQQSARLKNVFLGNTVVSLQSSKTSKVVAKGRLLIQSVSKVEQFALSSKVTDG